MNKEIRTLATSIALTVCVGCAPVVLRPDWAYFPQSSGAARVVHLKSFNRLHDLIPARVTFVDLIRGLPIGPYVERPAGVAYRDGHLYICDTQLAVVHDWDLTSGDARRLGEADGILLSKPVAVAVGADGTVYVADTGRSEVVAYPADGGSARRIRPPAVSEYRPVAVAAGHGRLYVSDIARHRIDVFSAPDGTYVRSFGGVGSGPSRVYYPMGVALDAGGHVLVSDMMNARVQVFDSTGKALLQMGRPGNRYGDMGQPRHLAVGPDGVIFVADAGFARVHLFNPRGQLLMLLGGPVGTVGATPMPVGVTIVPQLPPALASWVPDDFAASYFLVVTNSIGRRHISLFAVGVARETGS